MVELDYYWASNNDWWYFDENLVRRINEDAPEEAKESYNHYISQREDIDRRTGRYLIIYKNIEGMRLCDNHDIEWDEIDGENRYIKVVKIPYEEYKILMRTEIYDYMSEASDVCPRNRMNTAGIEKCIELMDEYAKQLPTSYSALLEARVYGISVDCAEEHII